MNPKIYIETTIISYLTAWPSQNLIVAAHQQLTSEWWRNRADDFDLYVSELVAQEAGLGSAEMVQRRLEMLQGLQTLKTTEAAILLAEELIKNGPLPSKAAEDALHIAVAVTNGMDYLLTWNCKHLANASMRNKIEMICRQMGYEPVIICTPEELPEEESNVD